MVGRGRKGGCENEDTGTLARYVSNKTTARRDEYAIARMKLNEIVEKKRGHGNT